MVKSYASPIVESTTSAKTLIVNNILDDLDKSKFIWTSLSDSIHTVVDVAQSPDGVILITQDEDVSTPDKINKSSTVNPRHYKKDLESMDGQEVFIEIEGKTYPLTGVKLSNSGLFVAYDKTKPKTFSTKSSSPSKLSIFANI